LILSLSAFTATEGNTAFQPARLLRTSELSRVTRAIAPVTFSRPKIIVPPRKFRER
jgi:hypothetical protein